MAFYTRTEVLFCTVLQPVQLNQCATSPVLNKSQFLRQRLPFGPAPFFSCDVNGFKYIADSHYCCTRLL